MKYMFVSGFSFLARSTNAGISQYKFNAETGELEFVRTFCDDTVFGMLYMDDERGILYALSESADFPGVRVGGGGSIYTFWMDRKTGQVTNMSVHPVLTANPCALAVDKENKYMVVASHGTRNYVTKIKKDVFGQFYSVVEFDDTPITLFSMNSDGSIGKILDIAMHIGDGPEPKQTHAHPHSVEMSPSGELFTVCDKGSDRVFMYKIEKERNELRLTTCPAMTDPGSEPRYCVYHPDLPILYHNNENNSKICTYRYSEDGELWLDGTCEILERKYAEKVNEQQGLCIHPTGRYLYSAVNGPDVIAVCRVDPDSGALTLMQNYAVGSEWPRGITISEDGQFIAVACMKGHKIIMLRVGNDGTLTSTGFEYDRPNAAATVFWNM